MGRDSEPNFLVFEGDAPEELTALLVDALLSVQKAVNLIETSRPETLAAFDSLVAEAEARSTDPFAVALARGEPITTPVAAILVANPMFHWFNGGADQIGVVHDRLKAEWPESISADQGGEPGILGASLTALDDLATLQFSIDAGDAVEPSDVTGAAENLEALARVAEGVGALEPAVACARSARNLIRLVDLEAAAEATDRVIRLVRRMGDPTQLVGDLAVRADQRVRLAESDATRRVAAFDAIEEALRVMLETGIRPPIALTALREPIVKRWAYAPFQATLSMILPEADRDDLPLIKQLGPALDRAEMADLPAVLSPVWRGATTEWLRKVQYVRSWSIPLENHRLALESVPDIKEKLGEANWTDWTVEYRTLLRAVPQGSSILKEEWLSLVLLTLQHEIAHVLCLNGFLGRALLALRLTRYESEVDLWANLKLHGADFDRDAPVRPRALAPLVEPDVMRLAMAEQGVELDREIQILQNVWTPWFEGVAVFGETAADPQMDPDAFSQAVSVIYNLWDTPVGQNARESGREVVEVAAERLAEAEALYSRAREDEARFRLRSYFDEAGAPKYLTGYLAVRAVVTSWRATLGRPLSGAQAYRVLLHATRFSELPELVPDPRLPVDSFREEAVDRHARWVASLARIAREDLEEIMGLYSTGAGVIGAGWRGGRLRVHREGEGGAIDSEAREQLRGLARNARDVLRGGHADPDRIEGADELCRAIAQAAVGALETISGEPRFVASDFLDRFYGSLLALPLGQADCPFWLFPDTHSVAVLIRTRETDKDTKKPSYNMIVFSPGAESFGVLERAVREVGIIRMRVTRIADLYERPRAAVGLNFMVYQFGAWSFTQNCGARTGSEYFDETTLGLIRYRLERNPLVLHQQWLTGPSFPATARTKRWIEANDWDVEIDGAPYDIGAWARHVAGLAGRVLGDDGREDQGMVTERLMASLYGDRLTARAALDAFNTLRNADSPAFGTLLRLLESTGLGPGAAEPPGADEVAARLQELGISLFEIRDGVRDVTSPAAVPSGSGGMP